MSGGLVAGRPTTMCGPSVSPSENNAATVRRTETPRTHVGGMSSCIAVTAVLHKAAEGSP